ncbi:spore germination protein GerPE [Lentibacillus sp. Marseille-P4043]|uniref:spore germination protein GerPE n=1 Tax=Lentibacillus sp. Marseille-P4043 TaxID=2040293 RepID=UPI000D0B2BDB|nr:spore germination protein GerPE [Lentibacillus sp. Marseille-P4043]
MEKRNVRVKHIKGNSVSFSSIFSIGDTATAGPKSNVIAVQKEGAIFTKKDDVEFTNYRLFNQAVKWPKNGKHVKQQINHHTNNINVHHASFIGVETSSIFQVGSIGNISTEARIKHFRILHDEDRNAAQST